MRVSKIHKSTSGLWGFAALGPMRASGHQGSFKCYTSAWINRHVSPWLQQWFWGKTLPWELTPVSVWMRCSRFSVPSLHNFTLLSVASLSLKQSNLLLSFNKTYSLQGLPDIYKRKKPITPRPTHYSSFFHALHSFMCSPQFLSNSIPLPLCLQSPKKAVLAFTHFSRHFICWSDYLNLFVCEFFTKTQILFRGKCQMFEYAKGTGA